jgi:glycosyltransferase involved in cell wall biosynthesis
MEEQPKTRGQIQPAERIVAMTIAFDARFLSPSAVHPHSRLVHIFLKQNALTPYPARIILYTDQKTGAAEIGKGYHAPNLTIRPLGPPGQRLQRLLWLYFRLPQALKRDGAAVFYSSFYFLPPHCRGVRLFNTIHDCCVFYIPPKLNRGLLSSPLYLKILKRAMRWTNRRAHTTITVSHFSKAMLHRHLGIPLPKIKVCYHGLEIAESGRPDAPAPGAGTDDHGFYFLFVGSNLPKKNIRQCIAGFARLPLNIRSRYKLRLKTGCYPEDRAQIEKLGLGDRVEFVDRHLDEAEMTALFKGANLLLLLSYDEGFGLPIIEAFAADVPVLVSNRAACEELVSLPECKADPDDTDEIAGKWLSLVVDQDLRKRCMAEQRRLLPQFARRTAADAFYSAITT